MGVGETELAVAHNCLVGECEPNPFTGSTQISYELPAASIVSITIYDLHGRRIRKIVDGRVDAGSYFALWDGKGEYDSDTPDGIYFMVFQTDG